jgi:hypothetical protein
MKSTVLGSIVLVLVLPIQNVPPPDVEGFPSAPAPGDLAVIQLPDTNAAVADVLERMPAQVAGHRRLAQFDPVSPNRATLGYGKDPRMAGFDSSLLRLQAINLAIPDFFPPNWTGGHVVAYMASSQKAAAEAGRDGDLFWMRNQTSEGVVGSTTQVVRYGIMWGRVDSPWLFSINADTGDNRDALLAAFVAAAKSASRE